MKTDIADRCIYIKEGMMSMFCGDTSPLRLSFCLLKYGHMDTTGDLWQAASS